MEKRQEEYRSMKVMPYLGTIPHSGGVGKLIDWGQYMKPSLRGAKSMKDSYSLVIDS